MWLRVGLIIVTVAACSTPPFSGSLDSPDVHDEDGDGIPDADDPCPHLAGPMAKHDSDGDGVGDACDPSPNDPGDSKRFYSFADRVEDLYIDGAVRPVRDAIEIGTLGAGDRPARRDGAARAA